MQPAQTIAEALDRFLAYALDPALGSWSQYVRERLTYLGEGAYGRQGDVRPLGRVLTREADREPALRSCPKVLISGHKGAGKSTELNRLAEELSDRYEVLHASVTSYLNENDVDARDLLYVLAGLAVDAVRRYQGLPLLDGDDEASAALELLHKQMPRPKLRDVEVGFGFFGVTARMRLDTELRQELRRIANLRPDDLRTVVDRCFAALEAIVERPVLVVIDDLDKVDPGAQGRERLFSLDFPLLLAPRTCVVYTIPIDVQYDERCVSVHHAPHRVVLGHIKLWEDRDRRAHFEPGWAVMREFVARRMDLALIEAPQLDRAIALSGGSFDQLRWLLHGSLDYCDFNGSDRIDAAALDNAAHRLRGDMVRLWGSPRHLAALHRIHQQKSCQWPEDLAYLPLLAVQEHVNDVPWFDVNPVLLPQVLQQASATEGPATP